MVHDADKDMLPHPCTDQQPDECLDLASQIVMASRVQQRQDGAATAAHASIREDGCANARNRKHVERVCVCCMVGRSFFVLPARSPLRHAPNHQLATRNSTRSG